MNPSLGISQESYDSHGILFFGVGVFKIPFFTGLTKRTSSVNELLHTRSDPKLETPKV